MIVTVKPTGREEFALKLSGQPTYTSARGIGYEIAEIPCEVDEEEYAVIRGGTLRIHGDTGIVWQGIVVRRPFRGEPLVAQGWGWCMTFGRREAMYVDNSLLPWRLRELETANQAWTLQAVGTTLRMVNPSGSESEGYNGFWRTVPTTSSATYTFGWSRGWIAYDQLVFFYGTSVNNEEPSSWTTASTIAAYGSGNGSGTASVSVTVAHNAVMLGLTSSGAGSSAQSLSRQLINPKCYCTGVTSPTTTNVITDILTDEVATTYLPSGSAYLAWIATDTTALEPLVFDDCDAKTKTDALSSYVAYEFGWYIENVNGPACVPHWSARPTTPDYTLQLVDAEDWDLDEAGLDELYSAVNVVWTHPTGRVFTEPVIDTTAGHPLVDAGIVRYGENLYVNSNASATAATYGAVFLADRGRAQLKGTVTTRDLYTDKGADVYLPSVRPGQMVRLMKPDGYVDAIISRIAMVGDEWANIELDNQPYRLDLMLANLERRSNS